MTQTLDDKNSVNKFVCSASDDERLDVLRKDGKLTLTDAQKQAVLTKGRVIVSAAAGSGKTSTMVKRIILMIAEGYSLRNMLVLVYNVAAADELKERLHGELFDRACSEVGEARERFSKELDDLPFCHICTIHSFCNSLLRDNFDKLGLSPTFEVLDEQAHAAYMNEALENVFSAYSEEGDDAFMDVVEIFSQARKEDNLKANIIKLHDMIDIQPDKKQFFDNVNSCYKFASIGKSENIYDDESDDELDDDFDEDDDFIDIWDEDEFADGEFGKIFENYYKSFFEDALKKFEEIAEMISGTVLSKHIEAVQIAIELCQEMLASADFNGMLSVAYDTEKPSLKGGSTKRSDYEKTWAAITKFYNDELFDIVKEMCELKEIWDDSENKFAQNALYVYKLLEITSRFDNELARLKKENNVLSFEDLQHLAVSLLKDYPSLGRVYDAVFVDEYQDVNPTQEFIIQKLIKGECFMVGDVKQSIYGFRLADPKIFLARQERYKNGGGTAIDFNRNFRSARKILAFVNGVFNAVMTEKTADVDYKNTAAFEIDGMPDDGRVEVHLFTDKKAERVDAQGLYDITDHVQAEEGVKAAISEGKFIAREIKSLVGRAKTDDGKYIGYGDIAILFRSRTTGAQQIIEVLRSEGIPVDESVFGKSESRPERELISMLRVLDNPRQDIPLAGFMLSFFGGYSEDELAFIAAQDGECLYDKVRGLSCDADHDDDNVVCLA
ncbi:MAG: UvrD-helicase domain-containing protein, partial [Clostridia bacterium]|nr:UvrD-helicase domain-containing protein [Clostridia bacterium]